MHAPFVIFRKAGDPEKPEIIRTDRVERVTVEDIEQVSPLSEENDVPESEMGTTLVPVTAVHLIGKSRPVLVYESPNEAMMKWRIALVGPIEGLN